MFKDEAGREINEEFISLRAKLYAIKKLDCEEDKKCKGVKRNVIRNKISFNDYKGVLFSGKKVLRKMNVIRSHQHNLSTEQANKVAVSANDDKRIIGVDKIQTLAHGYRTGLHGKPTREPTGRQGNRQWRPGKVTGETTGRQGRDRATGEPTGRQGKRCGDRGDDGVTGEAWHSGAK